MPTTMQGTMQGTKLDQLCNSMIRISKNIQSVAIINKFGKTIEKISKPSFTKQFPDYLNELFCMHYILQVSMDRDFDESYGSVNYYISERMRFTTLSIPFGGDVILVTANKDIPTKSLAKKILETIGVTSWS